VKGSGEGPRGQPLRVQTPGQNRKLQLFLAANGWTGQIRYRFYGRRRSQEYHAFEEHLARAGPLRLGLDHSHSTREAFEPAAGVERLFLPRYAWWWQPVDNRFGWLKRELANCEARDLAERRRQVEPLLKRWQSHLRRVLRLMGNRQALSLCTQF
jgi:hypothetical protein